MSLIWERAKDPIVLVTCGGCFHNISDPTLPMHTSFDGESNVHHWPVPESVAVKEGYEKCEWCEWEDYPKNCFELTPE
jgi:hypothetical protein